ncbi:MAG: hypothetical protein ACRERD_21670 [Candidatus Binatia bacterium]
MAQTQKRLFNLDPNLIRKAQKALGTKTATETVKKALESVAVDEEIWRVMNRMAQLKRKPIDCTRYREK